MRKVNTRELTLSAAVAALYAALTMAMPGPAFGFTQLRVSEALTVLPFLFPATAPGLAVGCLVANLLSPYGAVDIICGTAATALAAWLTRYSPNRWLAPLPPVICNGVIIGAMLAWYEAGFGSHFWPMFALAGPGVALGELAACYLLGGLLLRWLPKVPALRDMMPPKALK